MGRATTFPQLKKVKTTDPNWREWHDRYSMEQYNVNFIGIIAYDQMVYTPEHGLQPSADILYIFPATEANVKDIELLSETQPAFFDDFFDYTTVMTVEDVKEMKECGLLVSVQVSTNPIHHLFNVVMK